MMTIKNILGAGICIGIFLLAFAFWDNRLAFVNLSGLAVVVCGTLGALFLSHPYDHLTRAIQTSVQASTTSPPRPASLVQVLLELSIKARCHGLLSLEKYAGAQDTALIRHGIDLLVDGYTEEEIQDILSMEIALYRNHQQQSEAIFRGMGRIAPSFGVAGSVIGLIGMLSGLGDTETILQTIPMALTSTLYGIVCNQFFCTPLAEGIRSRTNAESLNAAIILEGILGIKQQWHPRKLERRLAALLSPDERSVTTRDFAAIHQKYIRMVRHQKQAGMAAQSPASGLPLQEVPGSS